MSQKVKQNQKSVDKDEKCDIDKKLENGIDVIQETPPKEPPKQNSDDKETPKENSVDKNFKKLSPDSTDKSISPDKTPKKSLQDSPNKSNSSDKSSKNSSPDSSDNTTKDKPAQNGDVEGVVTRSQTSTPMKKKIEHKEKDLMVVVEPIPEVPSEQETTTIDLESSKDLTVSDLGVTQDMEPLVLDSDETEPELQFDETSDTSMETAKESPVLNRCRTRRSQSATTPRKILTDGGKKDISGGFTSESVVSSEETFDSDNKSKTTENDDESSTSENLSTRAIAGSDSTRLNFTVSQEVTQPEENAFLRWSKQRSLGETLRGLSSRKSIRPLDDHRCRLLKSNHEKSELKCVTSNSYDYNGGIKRKNDRSVTPDGPKRRKMEPSTGLTGLISSPLGLLKNKFSRSEIPTSTPKLTGYRHRDNGLDETVVSDISEGGRDAESRKWCSIM